MNTSRFAAVLTALLLLSSCAGLATREAPPRVNLVNLQLIDMQLFEQRYGLTLRIQNPDRQPLEIEGLSFELELNGRPFAHGVSNTTVEVPAFGEALLDVEVVSTLFGIVDQLRSLEQRRGQPLSYRITGHIAIGGSLLSIPFEQQGELGGGKSTSPPPRPQGAAVHGPNRPVCAAPHREPTQLDENWYALNSTS